MSPFWAFSNCFCGDSVKPSPSTKYNNQLLLHNDQQNDTMICILQQIAVNTCGIWNETHRETELDKSIAAGVGKLASLYAATHADAALGLEREDELRRKIEACCPSEPPVPVCQEKPCPPPPPFEPQPPVIQPPPKVEQPSKG
jgi:hypothetical protein